jgi:uncharacterized membrane protein YhiD involved in acid resistance
MLNDLQNIFVLDITFSEIISNILVAFICGSIISILYRWTYEGINFSSSFANSLIMLSMITAVSIMVIGSNLARAFGMVGALSIIRFRTVIKDSQDIMFIFFALAIGMASGTGLYSLAFFATIFIGLIIIALSKWNILFRTKFYVLQVVCDAEKDYSESYHQIIKNYCRKFRVVRVRSLGKIGSLMNEITFSISLEDEKKIENFIGELKKIEGIKKVNLTHNEEISL